MAQWQSAALEARLGVINMNITFLLMGLYGWEYFQSIDVEYAVLRGRLAFRWPLIPYIVGRVSLFVFILLLAVQTGPTSGEIGCLPGIISIAVSADIALGCSTANLMIRTWVIWKDSRLVHTFLLVFALGQWIVLGLDVAILRPTELNGRCAVVDTHEKINAVVFLFSLCCEFLVLTLCILGLSRQSSKSPLGQRLRAQGLVYFVVAVITYIPPTVFAFLGVVYMVSFTGLAAITASTIASCRAVRSLLDLSNPQSSQMMEGSTENDIVLSTHIPVQTAVSGDV